MRVSTVACPCFQRCCYNENDGTLITTEDMNGGSMLFYNPIYSADLYKKYDETPKYDCCQLADMCNLYYDVRPLDNCKVYEPPSVGTYMCERE